jgi:hypothetical protein
MPLPLELSNVTISEKFLMMEQLWESLSKDAEENGFSPNWHFDVLDEREKRVKSGQATFSDISEARKRLQKLV